MVLGQMGVVEQWSDRDGLCFLFACSNSAFVPTCLRSRCVCTMRRVLGRVFRL